MALKSLNKHSGQPTFSKVKYFHQEYFLTIISLREYDSNPLVCKLSVAICSDLLFFTDFKMMPEILKRNLVVYPKAMQVTFTGFAGYFFSR